MRTAGNKQQSKEYPFDDPHTITVCYTFFPELFYFIAHKHDKSRHKTFVMNSRHKIIVRT